MKDLRDKVAVVTGAGSGIGRATAIALAEKGCHLAITDIREETLRETAKMIEGLGRKVSVHLVDAASRSQMAALPDAVLAAHGAVHIVVNNAGVAVAAPFEHQSLEDLDWILGINLWGVIYGCKFFLPHLKRAGEGHIVNISSIFGIVGPPNQSSYAVAKFGVRGLSESLRAELEPCGIGVTSVHPGAIKTNIVRDSRWDPDPQAVPPRQQALDFFEKRGVGPEVVAAALVRGIERNAMRVLVPGQAHFIDILKRLFPVGANRILNAIGRKQGVV
jgi:NAD(P)-dependent dehydrogenase (short-subunit alcohol dehydrogenase family)